MSGGSRDSELTALAVVPTGRPSGATEVTTVTPVAKWPTARRNSSLVMSTSVGVDAVIVISAHGSWRAHHCKAGSGFDIVSGGELYRVLRAGGDPSRVVFSGVGKTAAEIDYALEKRHPHFQLRVRSGTGADRRAGRRKWRHGGFSIRVNPDVDAATHPYISTGLREHKFGIDIAEAEAVYERARGCRNLAPDGVSCHIGSQIARYQPHSGGGRTRCWR